MIARRSLNPAYEPLEGTLFSSIQVSARACVLSMLSVAPRLGLSRQIIPSIDADLCATRAHCLLLRISDDVSLPTLQAAVMLLIQRACCTDWKGATFFQSIACRIVCAPRGHLYHTSALSGRDSDRSEREVHHIRMLFWVCYIIDKDISLFTGNPPLLAEFSTAAVLSLFLNAVIHPLDAQSRIDLELLISAANTISSMPAQALTKIEKFSYSRTKQVRYKADVAGDMCSDKGRK